MNPRPSHVLEGRLELLERERLVDHRVQAMRSDERAHPQKVRARADEDALDVRDLAEQRARTYLTVVACQSADDRERPAKCQTPN